MSRPPRPRLLAAGLLLATCFAVLSVLVASRWHPIVRFDVDADTSAHDALVGSPLRHVWLGITWLGSATVVNPVAALATLALLARRQTLAAVTVAVPRVASVAVEQGLKAVVDRPRPVFDHAIATASQSSYPSGHATGAASVYLALLVVAWPRSAPRARTALAFLAGLVVAAVAASRVLIGVHYPSDVLGGVLLGSACVLLVAGLVPLAPVVRASPAHDLATEGQLDLETPEAE